MKLPSRNQVSEIAARLWSVLTIRFDAQPISSAEAVVDFVQTRAAYVAQTSLYGYLKTRMGIRYPKVFEDEVFAKSIDLAKWNVFAACLSDLSVFAAATITRDAPAAPETAERIAGHCFGAALDNTLSGSGLEDVQERALADFAQRLEQTDWEKAAQGEAAFTASPEALFRWAPIADELKQHDREIVMNSIRFRWRDVREQLRKRVDGPSVVSGFEA